MAPNGARRTDVLWGFWYRVTYCWPHGHRYPAYGSEPGGVDDYCLNCGKNRGHGDT